LQERRPRSGADRCDGAAADPPPGRPSGAHAQEPEEDLDPGGRGRRQRRPGVPDQARRLTTGKVVAVAPGMADVAPLELPTISTCHLGNVAGGGPVTERLAHSYYQQNLAKGWSVDEVLAAVRPWKGFWI